MKGANNFVLILFFILLFISKNTMIILGVTDVNDNSQITRILPVVFCVFIYLPFIYSRINWKDVYIPILTLFLLIFICIFNKVTNRDIDISMYLNALVLPVIFSILFLGVFDQDIELMNRSRKLILIFYILECGLAITERVINYNFLPFALDEQFNNLYEDNSIFRASSLFGHSLANSLVTITIWIFILLSSFKFSTKIKYLTLGIIALISFNSRFAIVFSLTLFSIYIIYQMLSKRTRYLQKLRILILFPFFILTFSLVFFSLGWGDRLLEMGLFDNESAAVRTNLFTIFEYFKISEFTLGVSSEEVDFIKLYSGIASLKIENFWLIFLFRFGIYFLILLVISYFLLFKKMFAKYKLTQSLILSFLFIIVSSTNNSIDTGDPFITIFFLCIYSFTPKFINNSTQ